VRTLNDSLVLSGLAGRVTALPALENLTSLDSSNLASAVQACSKADAIVVVVGTSLDVVDEKEDLTTLKLPGLQVELIEQVAALGNPHTTVVAIMASPVLYRFWSFERCVVGQPNGL
jgi:hypothetical protein